MKLELKHLTPYLPYGLKVYLDEHDPKIGMYDMVGLSDEVMGSAYCVGNGYVTFRKGIENIRPILHPLSDLTKEIEHDGKKIVPIEKLGKIANMKLEYLDDDESGSRRYGEDISHDDYCAYKTLVLNSDGFAVHVYNDAGTMEWDEGLYANQLPLYEKLFSWHFDIYNLIDEGLAVDINNH